MNYKFDIGAVVTKITVAFKTTSEPQARKRKPPTKPETISSAKRAAVVAKLKLKHLDKSQNKQKQDCSYQGEALNVPTAF